MWFSDMAETVMSLKMCCFKLMQLRVWTHVRKINMAEKYLKLSHALIRLVLKKNHTSKDNLPSRYGKKI